MEQTISDLRRRILHGIRDRTFKDRHLKLFYKAITFGAKKNFQFVPSAPWGYGYTIEKVCAHLGYRVSEKPSNIGIYFVDKTFVDAPPPFAGVLLNGRCLDISKRRVEREFAHVFGYDLAIDPTTFDGLAVQKSDINAAHDGKIIRCPILKSEPDCVYERAINNIHGHLVEDIRLPIVGSTIPFAYLKYRFLRERFKNHNRRVKRVEVDTVLTRDEQAKVIDFARRMSLDFGELDALRDRTSGLLYIVDVNKTPGGPPAFMSAIERISAARALARAFRQEFLA